ncbi:hypothetical protein [Streptomyces sp. NPDC056723]|uniref:hypothetical protein n=1 Tax=Streptomyces sp. NPDC056723 TaxID=3345925 RepID=UPI00368DE425
MTEALTEALEAATTEVKAVDDLVERFQKARTLRTEIGAGDQALMEIQRAAVWALHEGRSWSQVGELLGFSGSRAEAIARGR